MDVLVAGGAGFVGRSLCRTLLERGHDVTATSRSSDPAAVPEGVDVAELDVADLDVPGRGPEGDDSTDGVADTSPERVADLAGDRVADRVAGRDAVANLIALPSHRDLPGPGHEAVHLGSTRALLDASEDAGVDRFLQLSALGAGRGVDVEYFRAKDAAERAVRDSALDWTIARPSVIFGDGAGLLRFLDRICPPLVVPLPAARTSRTQPIWVEDLAPMLADCLERGEHVGQTYDLGGPERLTLAELVRIVRDDPVIVPVPDPLARAGFALAERLSFVPAGRDQYRLLQLDNTTDDNDVTAFGVAEADLATLRASVDGTPRREVTDP